MKKITFLLLALSFSICSLAQIMIKGTVSNDSIPLESASVIIKNSQKGVATNDKGKFKLEAKKGDTLSVSYLGFQTKEVVVNRRENLNILLEVGNNLDEILVIGYESTTKCSYILCGGRIICGVECETEIIEEKLDKILPKLYPNPSSNGIFQLKLAENYDEVKISVTNLSGQTIQNSTHQKFGEKLNIDLSQYATGIYIISIIADGKSLETIKAIRG
jgi:hypothetical protein